jgi:cytochrome c biogenesis protein CcdA
MKAGAIEIAAIEEVRTQHSKRVVRWTAIACAAFFGSAVCLIAGVLASIAAAGGFIQSSRSAAHWTIGILATAFLLAFIGAHSLDRIDENKRKNLSVIKRSTDKA